MEPLTIAKDLTPPANRHPGYLMRFPLGIVLSFEPNSRGCQKAGAASRQ